MLIKPPIKPPATLERENSRVKINNISVSEYNNNRMLVSQD